MMVLRQVRCSAPGRTLMLGLKPCEGAIARAARGARPAGRPISAVRAAAGAAACGGAAVAGPAAGRRVHGLMVRTLRQPQCVTTQGTSAQLYAGTDAPLRQLTKAAASRASTAARAAGGRQVRVL